MTTRAIPTSGCARRRAKAIARRRFVHARENDRLVAAGHLPAHFVRLSTCPCGYISWLEEGADSEAQEDFERHSEDHMSYCDWSAA